MPRIHEDRQRHTLVDHRVGGPRVSFGDGAWCAVEIAAVKVDRAPATVSAYETLIELFRKTEPEDQTSAIFRSVDHRRVIAMLELRGNADFRHLAAAWDDHHLYAQHRASAEKTTLGLYRILDIAGDGRIEPASTDRYAVERIAKPATQVSKVLAPLALAPGFRGALLCGSADETTSIVMYRFEHQADFDAYRSSAPAVAALGAIGAPGESCVTVHPIRTFGASA